MLDIFLTTIVIVAVLLFGATETWSVAVVAVMTAAAFIYFTFRTKAADMYVPSTKGIVISMLLLAAYPLFQMIPLPLSVIGLLQPKITELVTLSPGTVPGFHSISAYPFATEIETARLWMCLMIFVMAAFGIKNEEQVYRILKVLVVFGFALSIFALIQKATWNDKIYWFRVLTHGQSMPTGPFVNHNHFAGLINMIIPFSLGFAFITKQKEKKTMFILTAVVMAIALLFSLSRGGTVAFIVGLAVFFFILFLRGKSNRKLIPLFVFVLMLVIYLGSLGIEPIIERFQQSGIDMSFESRVMAWQATFSAIMDYPVFGSGLGTFQYLFTSYKPIGNPIFSLLWDHAHNDYLEMVVELGALGGLICGMFLFFIFKERFGNGRSRDIYLRAAFISSISTLAVHSISDFNLHILSNAMLLFLLLGLYVASRKGTLDDSE